MKNKYIIIYNESLKFLYSIKPDSIDDKELDKYFFVEKNFKSKNEILEHLLGALQNYQKMSNVIGFDVKKSQFRKILYNFDGDKILKSYKTYEELLASFTKEFNVDKSILNRKNNMWVRYAKAVLSACIFLQQFKDYKDFDSFVNLFSYNESTAAALPMLLAKEIYGLGFALGCDFLKGLGYSQYPKPDVHLIDIFSELGLSDRDEFNCYKEIIRMAKAVNETPHKVDKVFWLICSGKYDYHGIRINRYKNQLIEYLKENVIKQVI